MRKITLGLIGALLMISCSARPQAPDMKGGTNATDSGTGDPSSGDSTGDGSSTGTATDGTSIGTTDGSTTAAKVEDTAAEMANVADANLLALTGAQSKQWGNDTLGQIEKDFRANGHLYYEAIDHKQTAFAWGTGVQMHALIAAGKIDDAQALADDVQTHYWCNKNGIWGMNAAADSCGDRYYDDNAWIAKALMELYGINHNAADLDRAKQITAFSMGGENSGAAAGSIRWHEGDADGQCLCATAPTMVSSLMLYEVTKEQKYLDDGKRLYAWIKANRFGAGGGYRGYENAVVAQGAILLYKNTKDDVYLQDARHIGHTMESHYVDVTTHALRETAQWGGHDMTNAYSDLYALDGDINWLNIVSGYLSFLHTNLKSPNNRYPENWDKAGNPENPALLYQASAARAFARFGETVGAFSKLPDPATIFYDCNYTGTEQKGLPIGRFTMADLAYLGFSNKQISSLKVQAGFKVTLYDQDNFAGESLVKTADTPCLVQEATNWNDRAQSVVVEAVTPAVTVSKDCKAGSYAVMLPAGRYNLDRLKARGLTENDLGNIQVGAGYKAVGYASGDFTGDPINFDKTTCVDAAQKGKIHSLRVVKFKE